MPRTTSSFLPCCLELFVDPHPTAPTLDWPTRVDREPMQVRSGETFWPPTTPEMSRHPSRDENDLDVNIQWKETRGYVSIAQKRLRMDW